MNALILPIVLLVIMIIFGIVFIVMSKKRDEKYSGTKASTSKSNTTNTTNSSAIKSDMKKEDVFKFMEFDRILDDMIVQNNGTRYTMAIKCKGINYDLMSDVEQLAVEEGFITFLNTLRYPIQLYVQAQNVDLKSAIAKYKENISGIREEYEKLDYQYTKTMEAFDSTTEEIEKVEKERNEVLNVYEYAADIINYVERMSYNKSLLQRNFYVLISYNTSEVSAVDRFSKEELINICYNELLTRCQNVISGLASCSVEGRVLDSNELADLLFTAYNRDDKSLLSVKEAIDSGFYRLYSTAEDAFIKKRKMLTEEIQNEAKIRALVALKESIENNEYVSPKIETIVNQEDISRKASEMVAREAGIPDDVKKRAQEKIVNDYKNIKKALINELEEEKANIIEEAKKVEGKLPKKEETEKNEIKQEEQSEPVVQNPDPIQVETHNEVTTEEPIYTTDNDMGYHQSIYNDPIGDSQKIKPSEVTKRRMNEENNMQNHSQSDELLFGDDRLGGNSDYDDDGEDDIII